MSAHMYRGQLDQKRKQRLEAERRAGDYRSKESAKRADAAKSRLAAGKTSSVSTARMKNSEAERREKEAETAGKEAARWQTKAANLARGSGAQPSTPDDTIWAK